MAQTLGTYTPLRHNGRGAPASREPLRRNGRGAPASRDPCDATVEARPRVVSLCDATVEARPRIVTIATQRSRRARESKLLRHNCEPAASARDHPACRTDLSSRIHCDTTVETRRRVLTNESQGFAVPRRVSAIVSQRVRGAPVCCWPRVGRYVVDPGQQDRPDPQRTHINRGAA